MYNCSHKIMSEYDTILKSRYFLFSSLYLLEKYLKDIDEN